MGGSGYGVRLRNSRSRRRTAYLRRASHFEDLCAAGPFLATAGGVFCRNLAMPPSASLAPSPPLFCRAHRLAGKRCGLHSRCLQRQIQSHTRNGEHSQAAFCGASNLRQTIMQALTVAHVNFRHACWGTNLLNVVLHLLAVFPDIEFACGKQQHTVIQYRWSTPAAPRRHHRVHNHREKRCARHCKVREAHVCSRCSSCIGSAQRTYRLDGVMMQEV